LPAKALFARRRELQVRIREAIRSRRYDIAVLNGGDMLWVLDELPPRMPTVLVAHNLEHRLLEQQLADHLILGPLFRRETVKQRRYELEGFSRVCGVLFVSAAEMVWSIEQVPEIRALHVPPLFMQSPAGRTLQRKDRLRLGYLADFAWWPNCRNWLWLMDEVLSRVRRSVEVHVFGRHSDGIAPRDGVVVHGMVSDLKAVWNQVDFMVCPIRAGAGVSIKVAESLYNRMPVLATPQAVRGFACASGAGLAVIDRAEAWAAFLDSPDADQLAAEAPSEELRGQFSLDRHVEPLDQFIEDVVCDRGVYGAHPNVPTPIEAAL
jgi:hypothetical protein